MDTTTIVATGLISLLIWAAILSAIISSASRSKSIELQLKIQTLLLAKIAQKQGVTDEEVNHIINVKQ